MLTVANEYGVGSCVACGAPMGDVQVQPCHFCGFLNSPKKSYCTQCKRKL